MPCGKRRAQNGRSLIKNGHPDRQKPPKDDARDGSEEAKEPGQRLEGEDEGAPVGPGIESGPPVAWRSG